MRCWSLMILLFLAATVSQAAPVAPAPVASTLPDDQVGFITEDLNESLADAINTIEKMREDVKTLNENNADKPRPGTKKRADDAKARLDAETTRLGTIVDRESKVFGTKVDRLGKDSDKLKEQMATAKEGAAEPLRVKFDEVYKKHEQLTAVAKRIDDYKQVPVVTAGSLLPQALIDGAAPAFDLKLAATGDPLKLDEFKGKAVVLLFWCAKGRSAGQLAPLVELLKPSSKVVTVIAINVGDTADDIRKVIDKNTLRDAHVVMDPTGAVAKTYKVGHLPQYDLIDMDGQVATVALGNSPKARSMIADKLEDVQKAAAAATAAKGANARH